MTISVKAHRYAARRTYSETDWPHRAITCSSIVISLVYRLFPKKATCRLGIPKYHANERHTGGSGELRRNTVEPEKSARRCHAVLRALLFFEAELQRR